jgi:putative ABC transport system permease protein
VRGFIAILIGAVGMMNTVLMSVFERTREIGVLRSLGWRKGRVLGLIIGESLALSLIGGLAGTALGIAAVRALGSSPATGGLLQGRFSPGLFIQALGLAGLAVDSSRGAALRGRLGWLWWEGKQRMGAPLWH